MRSIMEEVPLSPPSKNNDVDNTLSPGLRYRSPLQNKSNIAISHGDIDDDDDDTKSAAAIDNKQTIKCTFNKKKLFGITSFIAILIIIATVAMSNNGSKEDRPAVNNSNGSNSNNAVSIPSTEGTPTTDEAPDMAIANMADDTNGKSLITVSSTKHHVKSAKEMNGKASKKDGHDNATKSAKSAPDFPKRDSEWLSNLLTPGKCSTERSFGCGGTTVGPFGYYLACFDNPKKYEYITGFRFWTSSGSYGVREGIGAGISVYYGSKAGLITTGNPLPFSTLDVPATSDPQTTFIEGLNSFTIPGLGSPIVLPGTLPGTGNGLEGFCIGLTPPRRGLCFGRYCADPGLSVLTSGSSEGSYLSCNAGNPGNLPSQNDPNPARANAFVPNGGVPTVGAIPGFCIEAEVAKALFKATPDIEYGIADSESLLLDKYEPTFETSGLKPFAIFVHGGSCSGGSRKDAAYVDLARYFASNGFVALSVDYRLRSTLPSCRTTGSIEAAGR